MSPPDESETTEGLPYWGLGVWWVVYLLLYLSFVSPVTLTQIAAGTILAAIAVALSRVGMRESGLRLGGATPAVWRLAAVGRILVREAWAVATALVRQARGAGPVRGRFVAIAADEPRDPAADTAITLEAALAPNTYVVAYLEDEEVLLLHQFEPRPEVRRSFPRWAR